jgi:hypothetical protein
VLLHPCPVAPPFSRTAVTDVSATTVATPGTCRSCSTIEAGTVPPSGSGAVVSWPFVVSVMSRLATTTSVAA